MLRSATDRLLALFLLGSLTIVGGGLAIIVATLVNDRDEDGSPAPIASAAVPTVIGEAVIERAGISAADLLALGFGPLPPVTMPPDNPLSDAKVELGRMLFFDRRLSANSSLSCASCHQPAQGWGDGIDINFGFLPGTPHWRNSQTVINSAYLPKLFWAGEALSLEAQAKSAFTGITAQNLDTVLAEERLRQIPGYVERFAEVFGGGPSFDDALRAIAAFEATINSTNVPFDSYLGGDESALSEAAVRGAELFVGKGGCSACHTGPLLTDNSFHALGVPDNPKFATEPLRQITLRYQHVARGVPEEVYRSASTDLGLYYVTKQDVDKGKFRTPMLREVGQTGPYMHSGVLQTLEEVVQFYNSGGGSAGNKSPLLRPLGLTAGEAADLVAFLEALTGDSIIVEPPELPEYEVLE